MKKRVLLLFSIIPFICGLLWANIQGGTVGNTVSFHTNAIESSDMITISNLGNIYSLTDHSTNQITHNQTLIEPLAVNNNFVAIEKKTNYASLLQFDLQGNKIGTLFNGNSNKVDTMSWISDPAINSAQNKMAYVSDKDKFQTNVPDNALYVLDLSTGKSTNIAKPAPYSGGIAHPIFDPVDDNIILYDYYQYNPQTLLPYSTIEQYDNASGLITTLTYENKNAYQESLSADGNQILFLGRNEGLNTVTLYIADFNSSKGLSNIHPLLTGDLAYPEFSNTKNAIYFMQAEGNSGYNLMTATIQNGKLKNIKTVVSGNTLLGNSSYAIVKAK